MNVCDQCRAANCTVLLTVRGPNRTTYRLCARCYRGDAPLDPKAGR